MIYLTLLPCCFSSLAARNSIYKDEFKLCTYFTRSATEHPSASAMLRTLRDRQPSRPLLRVVTTSLGKVVSSSISSELANCPTCSNLGGFRWIW